MEIRGERLIHAGGVVCTYATTRNMTRDGSIEVHSTLFDSGGQKKTHKTPSIILTE